MATYVISDLHGQYKVFMKLLEKVGFSDKDSLYMLGDAIDRGPDGIKILRYVMNEPNIHFILGNHEFMMLNGVALDGSASANYEKLPGKDADIWIYGNGGNKTYYKYKLLKKNERLKILEWLQSCPLSTKVEVNKTVYLLTHSFFKEDKIDIPYRDIDYQTAFEIVWNSPFRRDVYADPSEYARYMPWKFVIGHVPIYRANPEYRELAPFITQNIIDIDGGCANRDSVGSDKRGGILLRLEDMQAFTCTLAECRCIKV